MKTLFFILSNLFVLPAFAQLSNTVYQNLFDEAGFNAKSIDLMRPVGATPGEAGVSESGAGSYSIPIKVPPGTNGIQPNLLVRYNAQGGNGLLGYGWSISTGSIITRGAKTKLVDDEAQGVALNNNDAFYLDGKRLYLKSGTYGASNSTYNFELEDFGQVEMKSVSSAGTQEFVYTSKDGMKMYYNPVNSLTKNGQSYYYSWYLKKVEDLYGNYYEYFYNLYQGEAYLSSIAYTKNAGQSLNHYNTINFHYSLRTDKSQGYDAGLSFTQSLLLDKIEIIGEYGATFKKYLFKYGYNGTFSLLREVAEQGTDGSELNSTIFRYGVNAETFTSTVIDPAPNQLKDIYYGDFDGDGIVDMLCHYYTNNSGQITYTGFAIWKRATSSAAWTQSSPFVSTPGNYEFNKQPFTVNSFLANDFNGDGRSDILLIKTSINSNGRKVIDFFKIYYPNETATAFTEETINPPVITGGTDYGTYNISGNTQGYNFITVGDFDGDGKSDFVLVLSNNNIYKNFYVRPNTPNVITRIKNPYTVSSSDGLNIDYNNGKLYALEMNGDGKSELLVVENAVAIVAEIVKNTSDPQHPWKFNRTVVDVYPNKWFDIVQFGDFNGDGKTDMITRDQSSDARELALNNGDKWLRAPLALDHSWVMSSLLSVGDFNGDGRSDYVHGYPLWSGGGASTSRVDIYLAKGNGYQKVQKAIPRLFNKLIATDFNGDGKDDLALNSTVDDPLYVYSLDFGFNNQLLYKVKDGHGLVNEFNYERLNSGNAFYSKNMASAYPINILNAPVWCVRQFSQPDGVGGVQTISHTYRNLLVNRSGKGVVGFEAHTVIDPLFNNRTETENVFSVDNKQLYVNTIRTYKHSTNEMLTQLFPGYQVTLLPGGRYQMQKTYNNEWDLTMGVTTGVTYTYDNFGNILTTTEIKSKLIMFPGDNPFHRTITTVPNYVTSGGLVPTVPSSVTVQKQRFINGSGITTKTTDFSYNNKGQISEQTDFVGLSKAVTTNYYYNNFGQVSSQSVNAPGLLTRVENYTYDYAQRFLASKTMPCPTCPGAPTLTETYQYEPLWGAIVSKKDAQCQQFYNTYDAFGKLKTTKDNYGTVATTAYTWVSGVANQLFRKTVTTPGQPYDQRAYDRQGRVTALYTVDKDGQAVRSFTTYNAKGQKISETNAHYTSESPMFTYYSYDAYDRLSQVQNFQGNATTTYQYPAGTHTLKTMTTMPDGRFKEQTFDATGVIQTVFDGGGTLSYEYNANNDLTSTKKDGITLLTNSYDDYGRLSQTVDPNAGTVNYEYNAYGELHRQTDNTGNLVEKTYDGLGRINTLVSPEGTTQYDYGLHYVFIPDPIVIPGAPFPSGTYCPTQVLTKITGYNGIEQVFAYNDKVNPIVKHETIDGQTYSTFYDYASNGNLLETTYPSGVTVKNTYNSLGFLTEKKDQSLNSLYQLLQTNGMGQPTQYKLGNNLTSEISYTNSLPRIYNTPGVQYLRLYFDQPSGNITARKDGIKNQEEVFEYDPLNRLTRAQVVGQAAIQYRYDPYVSPASQTLGNIRDKYDVGGYEYHATKINAVEKIWHMTDAQLPPLNISTTEQKITYTAQQRPSKIEEGNISYEITYSPQNERIKTVRKLRDRVSETKYYFEGCELIVNSQGSKWVTYVNGSPGLVAMIVSQNSTHTNHYVYTDHLGSILTVTDAAGNIEAEQNFDAWGRRRNPDTWVPLPAQVPPVQDWLARGYTGHEHLPHFALINMNARLYDPVVGRMLSPDNMIMGEMNTQGYNRYAYALNNPLVFTDPSGNWLAPVWFVLSFLGNYTSNLIYSKEASFKSALNSASNTVSDLGNAGRVTLSSGDHHRWSAGLDMLGLGVSIRYDYFNGNFNANASLGLYVSPMGAGPAASVGVGYQLGNFNLGINAGTNFNSYSAGASVAYYNKKGQWGLGYSFNYYSGADAQTTGAVMFRYKDFRFSMENDFLSNSGDKNRTATLTLGYKDYFVRGNIYTNDGKMDSDGVSIMEQNKDAESKLWGLNPRKGYWKQGMVLKSYLNFGYNYNGNVSSLGFSWKAVQDFLQNGLHQTGIKGIEAPYFLDYTKMDRGMYYNSGPRNIYSEW